MVDPESRRKDGVHSLLDPVPVRRYGEQSGLGVHGTGNQSSRDHVLQRPGGISRGPESKVGAFIFEIARSEIGYTDQRPSEYVAVITAAAIKTGYSGPLFLQGDHFQINAKKYLEDPNAETQAIKSLIREAVEAGFYNIDIDASTVVDLDRPTIQEQQEGNYSITADMTAMIRK